MWSPFYFYWNIYHDQQLSQSVGLVELNVFLKTLPQLVKKTDYSYRNAHGFPFTDIVLLNTRNKDNWSDRNYAGESVNLIVIVGSKSEHERIPELEALFIRIAEFTGWLLVDEYTDEGEEDFVLWQPEK
jgi:hypothetical protein